MNANQIVTARGNRWTAQTIDKILTNEKYVGNIVFNRRSFKLKKQVIDNPPDMWVRRNKALEPIIAAEIFAKAQKIIEKRRYRLTDQEALERLSDLWRRKGRLSNDIVIGAKSVPDTSTYIRRFGSLTAAYSLIGFRPKPRYLWAAVETKIRTIIDEMVAVIVAKIVRTGGSAAFDADARLLTLNDALTVCIGSARCISEGALLRWHVRIDRRAKSDLTLIAKMEPSNEKIQDYYLLPASELARTTVKRLSHAMHLRRRISLSDSVIWTS